MGAEWHLKFKRPPCFSYLYGSLGDEREDEAKAAKVRALFEGIF